MIFTNRFNEHLYILNHHINWKTATKNENKMNKNHPELAVDGISLCKSKTKANAKEIKSFWVQNQEVSLFI